MFYISKIDGTLSPYIEGEAYSQREGQANTQPVKQTDTLPPSGMVGLAAASLLNTNSNTAAKQTSTDIDEPDFDLPPKSVERILRVSTDEGGTERITRRTSSFNVEQSGRTAYRQPEAAQERKPALLAEQIMSAPVRTILELAPLSEAREVFLKKRFRHLPVVNKEGRLVGILSDRSFLRLLETAQGRSSELWEGETTVKDIMSATILTARPKTEIRGIARIMFKERIGAMPLLDEHGSLVGILTRSDILRAVVNRAPLELWV